MTNHFPTPSRRSRALRVAALGLASILAASALAAPATPRTKPIPVILDTDIGDDIDDTWALGLLLKSPELDLKLAVGDYGRPQYRARLLAKFLQTAGRTDVPVGVGVEYQAGGKEAQGEWIKDYDLRSYPGRVHPDGVQAMIETIMRSRERITLICIGPLPNVASALAREPRIADRARFVGMHGSVRVGYGGNKKAAPEWNVKAAPAACQRVFAATWDIVITPLDTCGLVNLAGEPYRQIRDSKDPVAAAIIQNYRLWAAHNQAADNPAETRSSTLFDTVAVYLAAKQDFCKMERLGIRITDDGMTVEDPLGKQALVATEWKDLEGYYRFLAERLTAESAR